MDGGFIQNAAYMLSTVTILSCIFLKVPQIMYLRKKKNANGMYIQAMLMEITSFTIVILYNYTNKYSVMTYLEYPVILLQVYVMLFYTLMYKNLLKLPVVPLVTIGYFGAIAGFLTGALSKSILDYLVPLCTPLSGFAKVTYIYGIINAANADAVSLTTWCISVFTNASRLFTIYVDSCDAKLVLNLAVSTLLSLGVLMTAIYYQNVTGILAQKSFFRHYELNLNKQKNKFHEHED